jgi:histidinol dehydrogenase
MTHYLKKAASPTLNKDSQQDVSTVVKGVIDRIRSDGDIAVRQYSEKFDQWSPTSFKLSKADIDAIMSAVSEQTIKDINEVQANVRAFATAQLNSIKDFEVEIRPGVHLGQKNLPIDSIGAYVLILHVSFVKAYI